MTKKLKYLLFGIVLLAGGFFSTKYYIHVMNEGLWLRKFRSSHDPQPTRDIKEKFSNSMNIQGLQDVHASGSNRPIFSDLKKRLSHVKGKIYVVDLTGGEIPYLHGKYPQDFLGYGEKHPHKLELKVRRFLIHGFGDITDKDYITEEEAARENGFEYIKFSNTRRQPPTNEIIDSLINIIESMGENDWIHFHCLGGKGRTTVALTLVDILKNGKKLPLEAIVERQYRMGGINTFDLTVWPKSAYTVETLTNRKMFVVHFYQYVNAPDGYGHSSWSEWAQRHNVAGMVDMD